MSKSNKTTIKPGAIVEFTKTVLKGDVTIGKGTVVHPTVQILAEGGPIVIGANNLLEEGVVLHNKLSEDGSERTMVIGDDNQFEVRSSSNALYIGNNNLVQMTAKLGADMKLENGCVVGVGMHLENRVLSDRTHCYIHDGMIQERTGRDFPPLQTQQLDYLRNVIPNYHKVHKPSKVEQ
ncbi:dynactin subunit 6-like [Watersipora subatra]|uniref:dynactin subunit 6-like n=1 Tax=Watersipora subatra TaxID=2589382 RepID=UPI00355B5987